jgi:hypothetical protein
VDPDSSTVDSTTEDLVAHPPRRAGRWAGRAGILVLVLIVLVGLSGALGLQTRTTTEEGGGYELEVEYPWLSRAGQPAPLHLQISRAGGFPGQTVTVELCDDLFDSLDFQNWYPNPSAETVGDRLVYEFDVPPGNVLDVSLDARVAPGELGGHDECTISVLEGELPMVTADFDSWRLP